MTTVNVYLNFNGNCEDAFNFYRSVLGGEFTYVGRFGDMPTEDGSPAVPESEKDKIMHIGLPVSKETMLMGSDTGFGVPETRQGNNFSISVATDSKQEADRIFGNLSAGGQVTMPMEQTFWGDYFGMFTDKFGINWMVSYNEEQQRQS